MARQTRALICFGPYAFIMAVSLICVSCVNQELKRLNFEATPLDPTAPELLEEQEGQETSINDDFIKA